MDPKQHSAAADWQAILRYSASHTVHRHIRRVLRWCRSNDRKEISLRDVRKDALGETVDVEQARDLVERMVAAGWLQAKETVQTGGRPRERWRVNSRLFGSAETAGTAESLIAVPAVPATAKPTKKKRQA
jgi:hypothetical protein